MPARRAAATASRAATTAILKPSAAPKAKAAPKRKAVAKKAAPKKSAVAKKAAPKKRAAPKKSASSSSPRRRVTKKSDGPKVKRARSAYIFFAMEKQKDFDKSTPIAERGRVIGAAWKKMSASQKAPYVKKAEADKARSARERASLKK